QDLAMLREVKGMTTERGKERSAAHFALEFNLNALDALEPRHVGTREDFGLCPLNVDLQEINHGDRVLRHQGRHRYSLDISRAGRLSVSVDARRPSSSVLLGHPQSSFGSPQRRLLHYDARTELLQVPTTKRDVSRVRFDGDDLGVRKSAEEIRTR